MADSNIPISTDTLIDIMRVLDAAGGALGYDLVHHDTWFNYLVQMLGPELTGELDAEARAEGLTVLAHLEDRPVFIDRARNLANDLGNLLRTQLSQAGIEFDEYE